MRDVDRTGSYARLIRQGLTLELRAGDDDRRYRLPGGFAQGAGLDPDTRFTPDDRRVKPVPGCTIIVIHSEEIA